VSRFTGNAASFGIVTSSVGTCAPIRGRVTSQTRLSTCAAARSPSGLTMISSAGVGSAPSPAGR
jgi:hypothetical protein